MFEDTIKYRKVHRIYILIAISFFSYTTNIKAWNEDICFGNLSIEDGLSQLTISAILQDSRGFLWFGTYDGLNRYDGYNFEIFRKIENDENSLCNDYINSIIEDTYGFIWIGTQKGLSRYDYENNSFLNFYKSQDSSGLSHQKVTSILFDRKGRLWIGTEGGLDLFDYATSSFKKGSIGNILSFNRIINMIEDSYNNIWIGTQNSGLIKFNPDSNSYQIFSYNSNDQNGLPDEPVRTIFEDSKRDLWVGTRNGLFIYNPGNQSFLRFGKDIFEDKKLNNEAVRCIAEDKKHNLYIGTNKGLNIINLTNGVIKTYNSNNLLNKDQDNFYVYSIFIDNSETVWLGTFFNGINYLNTFNQQFQYKCPSFKEHFIFSSIGPLAETQNKLWIGTNGGGLISYNGQTGQYEQHNIDLPGSTNITNAVKSIYIKGDTLILATETYEMIYFSIKDNKVIKAFNTSFPALIQNIYSDNKGKLLLCANDTLGLRLFDPEALTDEVITYIGINKKKMLFPFSTCVLNENPDIRWVGTRYAGLFLHDLNNNTVIRFRSDPENTTALKSNHITVIYLDSRNNIWIGTGDGGLSLYNRENNDFINYGIKDGLPSRNIYGILEDQNGNLWISTLSGLSKFDPVNKNFTNYLYGNGFPIQELSEYSFLKLSDKRIILGGNNGMVIFNPDEITSNTFIPPLVITEFTSLPFDKNDQSPLIKKFITQNENILLKHNQAGFMIQFVALNYIFPENNQYAYILEGFDNSWNYVGTRRMTIYTNLKRGNYIFKIKASNNDGLWNDNYLSLNIRVLPAPWFSWYAYILYSAIFIFFAWLFFKQLNLEHQIKTKQIEQENMKKIHQLRIRMFTNFSHELRTPLTLITGPVEDLLQLSNLDNNIRDKLTIIQNNAKRLLLRVNQLLDFRKHEAGKMQLKAIKSNFVPFIKDIFLTFHELSKKNNITFTLKVSSQKIIFWFDPQLIEKVLFNIFSNAFNNTPYGGKIEVSVSLISKKDGKDLSLTLETLDPKKLNDAFVEISIKDTGKGIPENDLEKIFDPFYQVDRHDQGDSGGTGIGLSLSKSIVELHSGTIKVESQTAGGSKFIVLLPAGSAHLKHEEMLSDYSKKESWAQNLVPDVSAFPEDEEVINIEPTSRTILIIEDNEDVRNYINQSLKVYYKIIEAQNGEEGYSLATSYIPDVIISDIMIPGIDGLELCAKLKKNVHTSHIPIIFLTALATLKHVKEGFEAGADDYIIKPFNSDILKMKIDSLITNRERIKEVFESKFPFDLSNVDSRSFEEEFLEKVYEILKRHISDSEFNIDSFSQEIGMSRATLYRKIKSLTALSPNDLIKNYRLKFSIQLLKEKKYSITEISYKVGFSTPSYFTNSFKKAYGYSPAEFINKGFPSLKETTFIK